MSTTRYKIRLWEYDGEASVANAVTFDSFAEAEARFNDLRVSEEMPCVEFIKERIANGCIIGDEVLNVRQFASVFDAITKDKPTLAGFLRSLPVIEAPWDAAFQKRYCSSCTAENCDACANEQFRNNPEWWFSLLAADVLTRYRAERDGEENVGRVLPAEYCFFTGDGRRNHFTTEWKSTDRFGWTLESPYTD